MASQGADAGFDGDIISGLPIASDGDKSETDAELHICTELVESESGTNTGEAALSIVLEDASGSMTVTLTPEQRDRLKQLL